LDKVCKKLINLQHFEINITGGEPCMSPYINDILKLLRERRMWFEKIVLTTNGSFLMDNWENIINTVQK
ncbi:MAG: hypothetical protein FWD60_13815, partial [Candidatus Azobacteroides sp.]|nr:hypothetical protein [Candidatus Azobacteroides sp.]